MGKRLTGSLVLGLFLVTTVEVAAQARPYSEDEAALAAAGEGAGGFFDWIHKLSGPTFVGPKLSLFYELGGQYEGEPGLRIRVDAATRWAIRKEGEVDPASTSIRMQTVQVGLELPILGYPVYAAPGFALHRFTGDEFDSFSTWSVPATLGLRPRTGWRAGGLLIVPVLNAAIHYFPAFDEDDFAPIDVSVSRDAPEAVLQFSLGFDVRW